MEKTNGTKKKLGRPFGAKQKTPLKNWIPVASTISPEAREFLDQKKKEGASINELLDKAVLDFKAKMKEEQEVEQ